MYPNEPRKELITFSKNIIEILESWKNEMSSYQILRESAIEELLKKVDKYLSNFSFITSY